MTPTEEETAVAGSGTPDLELRTGATYRQLDYWATLGYLRFPDDPENPPAAGRSEANPGSGWARTWLPDELRVAAVIVRLLAAGLKLHVAASAARELCDGAEAVELAPGVTLRAGLEPTEVTS